MLPRLEKLSATVAVVPFGSVQCDPEHVVLGDVLADELNAALALAPELAVISRLSTSQLAGKDDLAYRARKLLAADYVLAGTYRTSGGRIDVEAEFVDTQTGDVVWAGRCRGSASALWEGSETLTAEISHGVQNSVLACETRRARASGLGNLQAHSLLLGAIGLMHGPGRGEFERAREALEGVAARQDHHALPQAWLAHWHVLKAVLGRSADPVTQLRLAADCSARAIDLQSDCALALTMDGFVRTHQHDLDGAMRRFDQAVFANPSEPMAWLLKSALHAFRDEGALAVAAAARACSLSPLDPLRYFYDSLSATAAIAAGRFDEGLVLARRAASANPIHTSSLRALAACHVQLGELDLARQAMERLRALEPGLTVSGYLASHPAGRSRIGMLVARSLREAGLPP